MYSGVRGEKFIKNYPLLDYFLKELMKLILAITRDNEKLIYEVCKENGFDSPQVLTGVDNLKKFADKSLEI